MTNDENLQTEPPQTSADSATSQSAEEKVAYLRLALTSGVGPKMIRTLLDHFESAQNVLAATLSQLGEVPNVGPRLATAVRDAAQSDLGDKVIAHCKDHKVRILIPGAVDFPKLLGELPDPPPLLFCRGELQPADQLAIGIVGTRHPTTYGKNITQSLTRTLARAGLTIASGLARGIDALAHRSAMEVEGRTVAFLGSSVTDIYPPEHAELADEVATCGALLSETHPFAKPKSGVFPQRNRLISGFSLGVIVVEAADRSGALITARHAGEQGRDLFAVPGPVTSRMSRGTNSLIRDGAILIQDGKDVIDHLGPLFEQAQIDEETVVHHPAELQLNEQEQAVLQAIGSQPTDMDQVIAKSGLPAPRVLGTISVLEMKGMIRRSGGRDVYRV